MGNGGKMGVNEKMDSKKIKEEGKEQRRDRSRMIKEKKS